MFPYTRTLFSATHFNLTWMIFDYRLRVVLRRSPVHLLSRMSNSGLSFQCCPIPYVQLNATAKKRFRSFLNYLIHKKVPCGYWGKKQDDRCQHTLKHSRFATPEHSIFLRTALMKESCARHTLHSVIPLTKRLAKTTPRPSSIFMLKGAPQAYKHSRTACLRFYRERESRFPHSPKETKS